MPPNTLQTKTYHVQGKLKIFVSYATGVGKTYAMLQQAHHQLIAGVDVVIASLNHTDTPEISTLLRNLNLKPLAQVNLDDLLSRQPQLLLIENLAQRNPPGSRHAYRYEDILELLEAGIDVYTTLNIQELAGLSDVVHRITGQSAQQVIPDHFFDGADSIELIDMPPHELIHRFHTGQFDFSAPLDDKFFRLVI